MITHLDNLLRHLFLDQVDGLQNEQQVRFQPPDDDWRSYVSGLSVDGQPANALNVYLVDLREDRQRRINAQMRHRQNGKLVKQSPPAQMDCHYLISAWSPVAVTENMEPTLDEHTLLYATTAALMHHAPLNPSRIYPAGSPALASVPDPIRERDLHTQVLPGEGFPKLAEFWSGMGNGARWKPTIYLVVTLPVVLPPEEIPDAVVTTYIASYRKTQQPDAVIDVRIRIGGRVLDGSATPPQPLDSDEPTHVQLETPAGKRLQETETDGDGRFSFGGLAPGQYQLRYNHPDFTEQTETVTVNDQSAANEYDLLFHP